MVKKFVNREVDTMTSEFGVRAIFARVRAFEWNDRKNAAICVTTELTLNTPGG